MISAFIYAASFGAVIYVSWVGVSALMRLAAGRGIDVGALTEDEPWGEFVDAHKWRREDA